MKKSTLIGKLQGGIQKANVSVTFEAVQGKDNVLKANVTRDGRKHELYVLAIPEDNFESVMTEQDEKLGELSPAY